MKAENFKIKKNGNVYRMNIPFGFDAKIEKGEVVLTKHWTILDAERGDIVAEGGEHPTLHCLYFVAAGRVYASASWYDYPDDSEPSGRYRDFDFDPNGAIDSIAADWRPATEDEKATFFKEMESAGYEYDERLRKVVRKGEEILSVEIEES